MHLRAGDKRNTDANDQGHEDDITNAHFDIGIEEVAENLSIIDHVKFGS